LGLLLLSYITAHSSPAFSTAATTAGNAASITLRVGSALLGCW